jgi:hypothetical protein
VFRFSQNDGEIMKSLRGLQAGAGAVLLAGALLGGCVVAPAPGYYGGAVVTLAPPAPQVEVVGVAPTPGYVWFGGYWNWVGGWRMHEGHWAR